MVKVSFNFRQDVTCSGPHEMGTFFLNRESSAKPGINLCRFGGRSKRVSDGQELAKFKWCGFIGWRGVCQVIYFSTSKSALSVGSSIIRSIVVRKKRLGKSFRCLGDVGERIIRSSRQAKNIVSDLDTETVYQSLKGSESIPLSKKQANEVKNTKGGDECGLASIRDDIGIC